MLLKLDIQTPVDVRVLVVVLLKTRLLSVMADAAAAAPATVKARTTNGLLWREEKRIVSCF